jgi:hypothetical protein
MYLASRQSFANTQMFHEHGEYRKLDTNLTVTFDNFPQLCLQ